MTSSINIDPSKLSDEELQTVALAAASDLGRAQAQLDKLDKFFDELVAEMRKRGIKP